jgi:ribosome biogenesis SPOUT family RNA methylase Rps3
VVKKERPESVVLRGLRCPKCKEVVVSLHVHDFRWCGCKSLAIDGGSEYCKIVTDNGVQFSDIESVEVRMSTGYQT